LPWSSRSITSSASGVGQNRTWFGALIPRIIAAVLWYLPLTRIAAGFGVGPARGHPVGVHAAIAVSRKLFDTAYFAGMLRDRFVGWIGAALQSDPSGERLIIMDGETTKWTPRLESIVDPAGFVASPSLWIGVAVAGLLLWAAIAVRRHRTEN
jgi:hypothetical protein